MCRPDEFPPYEPDAAPNRERYLQFVAREEPKPHCEGPLCPDCLAWVQRINDGASRAVVELANGKMLGPHSGGRWALPWINREDMNYRGQ